MSSQLHIFGELMQKVWSDSCSCGSSQRWEMIEMNLQRGLIPQNNPSSCGSLPVWPLLTSHGFRNHISGAANQLSNKTSCLFYTRSQMLQLTVTFSCLEHVWGKWLINMPMGYLWWHTRSKLENKMEKKKRPKHLAFQKVNKLLLKPPKF